MKDESDKKIMTRFVGLTAKFCSHLIYDASEDKKTKAQKSVS